MSRKSAANQTIIKYSWKFYVIISVWIMILAMIILFAGLSIKAVVQDIQLIIYENKVEGEVSFANFFGERSSYSAGGSRETKFFYAHYVITFDKQTAGYDQYEYRAKNIIITEKYVGDRYVVLFNDIENPVLIQKDDIATDNVILIGFSFFVITLLIFRKRVLEWGVKAGEKLNDFCL